MTRTFPSGARHAGHGPYLTAVAAVGLAMAVAAAADVLDVGVPLALVFGAAVGVAAARGGRRAGVTAVALAVAATSYLFVAPRGQWSLDWEVARLAAAYAAAVPAGRAVAWVRAAARSRVPARLRPRAAQLLARVPALAGLPDDRRVALAGRLRVWWVAAFDRPPGLGGPGAEFFIVVRGRLEVSRGGRVADVLGPGRWHGEPSLAGTGRGPVAFRARGDVVLFVLSRRAFVRAVRPGVARPTAPPGRTSGR